MRNAVVALLVVLGLAVGPLAGKHPNAPSEDPSLTTRQQGQSPGAQLSKSISEVMLQDL